MNSPKVFNRRQLLKTSAFLAATPGIIRAGAQPAAPAAAAGPHKLPPLGYGFDALEPHFDARTMEIHHDKHHATYVSNLNKALADYPDLHGLTVEELVKKLDRVPEKIRATVRNNAGGHYNHSLFWQCLKRDGRQEGPKDSLGEAFGQLCEDKEKCDEAFLKAALGVFGSGWVWLTVDENKKLKFESTPNQDSPLMSGRQPLGGLDVWEHAYYLKYQNRRADYVKAFTNIINWEFLQQRWEKLTA